MSTDLEDIARTSRDVRRTQSRLEKRDRLVALFIGCERGEMHLAASYLAGELPQGALGIGWRSLRAATPAPREPLPLFAGTSEAPQGPPGAPTLTELDAQLSAIATLSGEGSTRQRQALVADLFARLSPDGREFLAKLLLGELRQGALRALVVDALAVALAVPIDALRHGIMIAGSFASAVETAAQGGEAGLESLTLAPLTAIEPMLASAAATATEAMHGRERAAAECKLDGMRVQLHVDGTEVRVFTRALRDVTSSLPELVELAPRLGSRRAILDGEVTALDDSGRPIPFQDLMRLVTRKEPLRNATHSIAVTFFDCLYVGGRELLAAPYAERRRALETLVPRQLLIAQRVVSTAEEAEMELARALQAGHEGIVLKTLDAPYRAGRRGSQWIKLKPAITLDLVILAAEWGHGRRQGFMSNLHLGARRTDRPGELAMLGKTFKGLTDAMLRELTDDLASIALSDDGHVVRVEPLRVVEIAFDTVQRSKRYDSGVALRFARVKRLRPDKSPADAATLDEVKRHLERGSGRASKR